SFRCKFSSDGDLDAEGLRLHDSLNSPVRGSAEVDASLEGLRNLGRDNLRILLRNVNVSNGKLGIFNMEFFLQNLRQISNTLAPSANNHSRLRSVDDDSCAYGAFCELYVAVSCAFQ